MRTIEKQSAEDYRDTLYGQQLLHGFRRLLFVPELEREFRLYLDRQARLAQQLGASLLILVVGGYLYAEYWPFGTCDATSGCPWQPRYCEHRCGDAAAGTDGRAAVSDRRCRIV